ncbi:hypothetical protein [Candidatus Enterococcus clewellii]|uniref:Uncharacterized protein n=1 Tax=Candidatus Enterococcus clewellii TaxID=1834193 RepID=A0A242K8K0_9ENTE|nr:hypothetical protein [Enterococcus sp. 9E7_DIV0242]OTP17399.1 hypothetical protein A5888_001537 [Enterococcus sp. 9E7_DIV0242]
MIEQEVLKRELAQALTTHIRLLKDVEEFEAEHGDALTFMMRSFGFMLDGAPEILLEENEEPLYYMMFQYYSLLTELKYNLILNYPYSKLNGRKVIDLVNDFPVTYEKEMKQWWEAMTGLEVEETKQTIALKELEY